MGGYPVIQKDHFLFQPSGLRKFMKSVALSESEFSDAHDGSVDSLLLEYLSFGLCAACYVLSSAVCFHLILFLRSSQFGNAMGCMLLLFSLLLLCFQ